MKSKAVREGGGKQVPGEIFVTLPSLSYLGSWEIACFLFCTPKIVMTFLKSTYFLLAGYRNSHLISEHKVRVKVTSASVERKLF